MELRLEYYQCSKEAKRAVAIARAAALQGLYDELEGVSMKTAHREQAADDRREQKMVNGPSIFKITAQGRRNAMEITSPKFINDVNGYLLTENREICGRWKEYGEQFLNEGYPRTDFYNVDPHEDEIPDISIEEVKVACQQMKNNKAVGPDLLPSEVWKELGAVGFLLFSTRSCVEYLCPRTLELVSFYPFTREKVILEAAKIFEQSSSCVIP